MPTERKNAVRKAIENGKIITLTFKNGGGRVDYRITKHSSSGASCLVYETEKLGEIDHKAVIKEFYPKDCRSWFHRGEDGVSLSYSDINNTIEDIFKSRFVDGLEKQTEYYDLDTGHAMFGHAELAENDDKVPYLVSGFTHGRTLTHYRKDLSLYDIAQVMQSLCNAVGTLHGQKKLFLDIKPDNIYIRKIDGVYHVSLFDFDSVISIKGREGEWITEDENSYTQEWCAPEQRWNSPDHDKVNKVFKKVGFQSDIFSIGAVFYWLISGKEAGEDWLRDVDERVQQDILGKCPKLRGFANATETARKILFDTLSSEASERTNDIGGLVAMAKELEKNAETGAENKPISDKIDEVIKMMRETYNGVDDQPNIAYDQNDEDMDDAHYFIAISHAGQNSTYINNLVERIVRAFPTKKVFYDKNDYCEIESLPDRKTFFRNVFLNAEFVVVFMSKEYNSNTVAQEEFAFIWERYKNNVNTNGIVWITCDGEVSDKLKSTSIPANMLGRNDEEILKIISSKIRKFERAKRHPNNMVDSATDELEDYNGVLQMILPDDALRRIRKILINHIENSQFDLFFNELNKLGDFSSNHYVVLFKAEAKTFYRQKAISPFSERTSELRNMLSLKLLDFVDEISSEMLKGGEN